MHWKWDNWDVYNYVIDGADTKLLKQQYNIMERRVIDGQTAYAQAICTDFFINHSPNAKAHIQHMMEVGFKKFVKGERKSDFDPVGRVK
jgi:hypothetical protein